MQLLLDRLIMRGLGGTRGSWVGAGTAPARCVWEMPAVLAVVVRIEMDVDARIQRGASTGEGGGRVPCVRVSRVRRARGVLHHSGCDCDAVRTVQWGTP